jgi:16S rRNA (guanine966-N2)-methyltransferase
VRIVAGRLKGRRLVAPEGLTTRPTADRARQALFDMIMHAPWARDAVAGAAVLDAFAGTGALGLEALSRGAVSAHFIERDRNALAALRANIAACGVVEASQVWPGDTTRPPLGRPCGLIFLDPPYGQGLVPTALTALGARGWLAVNALIIAEVGATEPPSTSLPLLADRVQGAARLTVWRWRPDAPREHEPAGRLDRRLV